MSVKADRYSKLNFLYFGVLRHVRFAVKTLIVSLTFLLSFTSYAFFSGGIFTIATWMLGSSGGQQSSGGNLQLVSSVAAPQGVVRTMTGGTYVLRTGFFSGQTGAAPAASAMSLTDLKYDTPVDEYAGLVITSSITLTFSKAMKPSTIADGIKIFQSETPINSAIAPQNEIALSYSIDSASTTVTICPSSGVWAYNSTYRIETTTALVDTEGYKFSPTFKSTFTTMLDSDIDNIIYAEDGQTQISIPDGSISDDFFMIVRTDPLSDPDQVDPNIILEANNKASFAWGARRSAVTTREFTVYRTVNQVVEGLQNEATITIPYADANGNGIEDVSESTDHPIRAKNLVVAWLDESKRLWVPLTNSTVDQTAKTVSVRVNHFSTFAIIGKADTSLSYLQVYPVPWRPFSNNPSRYGTLSEGISFVSLPDQSTVKIFTLTGELVKTINHTGVATEKWFGTNDNNNKVASGVYRCLIKSPSDKKIVKVMVIW
ncbi:Ig-like domain-containing protein [Elusimicrobiota bacterium]